jgi:hypothetical protein
VLLLSRQLLLLLLLFYTFSVSRYQQCCFCQQFCSTVTVVRVPGCKCKTLNYTTWQRIASSATGNVQLKEMYVSREYAALSAAALLLR